MSYRKTHRKTIQWNQDKETQNDKFNREIEIIQKNQTTSKVEEYNEWNENENIGLAKKLQKTPNELLGQPNRKDKGD